LFAAKDLRNVAALPELDYYVVVPTFRLIILFKLGPEAPRFNPNNRIDAGVERLEFVEHLDSDEIFLESALAPFQALFNRETKKSPKAF
jgi:hypothetical protein